MRYTTIIDISEIREVYRNKTARLLYLHLTLRAGYHDADRDQARISIRRLASESCVSISATRHALRVLEAAHLIRREANAWIVTKWLPEQTVTSRPKTKREMADQIQRLERERLNAIQVEKERKDKANYNAEAALQSDGFKNLERRLANMTSPKKK